MTSPGPEGPPSGELPVLLDEKQVADILKTTVWRVQELRKSGQLPCIALAKGRYFRFTHAHIQEFLAGAETQRVPSARTTPGNGRARRRRTPA